VAKVAENGAYACLDDIARSEKVGASFDSRYYRVVLQAPDIIDAILDGRQPAQLTVKDLGRSEQVATDESDEREFCRE
jgi:hypothetical protein